jgi:hypothetical protein
MKPHILKYHILALPHFKTLHKWHHIESFHLSGFLHTAYLLESFHLIVVYSFPLLYHIPLHEQDSLFIHSGWVFYSLELLQIILPWIFLYVSWYRRIHISVRYKLGNELSRSQSIYISKFNRWWQLVFQSAYTYIIPHYPCGYEFLLLQIFTKICYHL